ncbi:coiled-coil domain-containing protein 40-like isoform X1 [Entelurus aequoreus]|uniref:coiled-coil domain-containing protein 40-like isoform X1 n=2 Tax=Entelurus aequoreus TaxID=161455 RepID=UPI002B1E81A4|nr:coiled-coil domain-containing protein 40-like isoform X1 [Entelurus aequoreus]
MEQQDGHEHEAKHCDGNGSLPQDVTTSEPCIRSQADENSEEESALMTHSAHFLDPSEDMDEDNQLMEEDEMELLILDAEHPLVAEKQAALKNQLMKELERLILDIKEEVAIEMAESNQIEEIYLELFREQETLKQLHTRLEGQQQTKILAESKHQQVQDQLEAMRTCHTSNTNQCDKTRANVSNLQKELEKLMPHLNFTQEVSEDLHCNVKAMKNVTSKARAKRSQVEEEKFTQDMYVEHLTKDLERQTQQRDMYEVQRKAQAETTRATKEALSEAEIQIESLAMSQRQLLQQWNRSLVDLKRRDGDFQAMQEAVSMAEHQVIMLDREIEGSKKSISELQEKSETLTMLLNCAQMDCEVSKKMMSQNQNQYEAVQAQYGICSRALGETERTLAELTKEDNGLQAEVTDHRRKLEKNKEKHLKLEDKIMTQMLQKLMDSKAAQFYQRLTNKTASLKKEKAYQLWHLESEVMATTLESNVINEKLENLCRSLKELDEEITKYNKVVTSTQADSFSMDLLISQKQTTIVNYNNKIYLIGTNTGHGDLSPLQINVEGIKSQIEKLSEKIKNDQQLWLKHQGMLVGLILDIQAHRKEYNKSQAKFTVIRQKKIYLERQFETMHHEESDLEKSSEMLQRDLLKLNTLLSKNTQLCDALEQENSAMQADFLHKLKDADRESIEMALKLEKTQEEKEKLFTGLLETQHHIMLWEKKTHLMKETRLVVEESQEDIQIIKNDIHCMERQLHQLMKQRQQLQRESVSVVEKRGNIIERNKALARNAKKQITMAKPHQMNEGLRRKVKETHKQVKECEHEITGLQESKVILSNALVQHKRQLTDLSGTCDVLEADLTNSRDTKHMAHAHLMDFQRKAKKLQEVTDGEYQPLSSSQSVEATTQSQMDRVRDMSNIIASVCEEYTHHQAALRALSLSLAASTHTLLKQEAICGVHYTLISGVESTTRSVFQ